MDTLKLKLTPLKLVLSMLIAAGLVGCVNPAPAPVVDENFGNAVNAAKAQQIVNPDASLNTDPVAGVDGQAADAAMNRYHRSFVQPPITPNIFNIGVSSGGGSTSGTSGGTSGTSR